MIHGRSLGAFTQWFEDELSRNDAKLEFIAFSVDARTRGG